MDEKETRDDGMNMDKLHSNQKEAIEGEINPMAITEVDTNGVHPYQHSEHMELRRESKKVSHCHNSIEGNHSDFTESDRSLSYTRPYIRCNGPDKKRALGFYLLAVHLTPNDASLWKLLVNWSLEQGNGAQARYCLDRAIKEDPEDMGLRYHRASLFVELGKHQKAAESYEQIWKLRPKNLDALKTAAKLYKKCGQHERGINILEDYLKRTPEDTDEGVAHLLASFLMSENAHER
ncbi:hypothetical protein M8C21_019913 [Ambrosia artemisiifolia]|uniref:Uncharacterized protein n=1 Tax=Ambrosia artemisiifolia TaxID=4212 RepID=A0AAD5D9L1_AMBAR|nr:hypothetical protein M8C21_019913 [Ambrosia artemisiifolia]